MTDSTRCPRCGTEQDAALADRCPKCLLLLGLEPAPGEARTIAEYEVLEEVGRGAMGLVCKAYQRSLNRVVALKLLPEDLGSDRACAQRFLKEARAAARLNHPNLVTIHAVGDDGQPYIAMEFISGRSLQERVDADGPLEAEEAAAIVRDTAAGLHAAHEEGVLHRDIKPGNIMTDEAGRVKLLDFGLARTAAGGMRLASNDSVRGTQPYIAPEEWRGEPPSIRTDVYSLGATFYALLTGHPPEGPGPEPPPASDFPAALRDILGKMLAAEPSARYASAREAYEALDAALGGASARRPRAGWWFAAAAALLAAAAGAMLLWRSGPAAYWQTDDAHVNVAAAAPGYEVVFSENWESGGMAPEKYEIWGEPAPVLETDHGLGEAAYDPNGDGYLASGIETRDYFDLSQGSFRLEFEVNTLPCGSPRMSRDQNLGIGVIRPSLLRDLSEARDRVPNTLLSMGVSLARGIHNAGGAAVTSPRSDTPYPPEMDGAWRTCIIECSEDGEVKAQIEGCQPIEKRVDKQKLTRCAIGLWGRSNGRAGECDLLIDNIKLSIKDGARNPIELDYAQLGVAAHYPLEGLLSDETGARPDAQADGGAFVRGRMGRAYALNRGDPLRVPGPGADGPWAVALWFRAAEDGMPERGDNITLVRGGSGEAEATLDISHTGIQLTLPGCEPLRHETSIVPGQWRHAAFGAGDGRAVLYVDGERAAAADVRQAAAVLLSDGLIVGEPGPDGRAFAGRIDDAVVMNRLPEPEDVAALCADSDVDGLADFWEAAPLLP